MKKRIELVFDKTLSRLAGNSFGQEIYTKQVQDKFDFSEGCIIVIPEHIEDIAISFIQGFADAIISRVGKDRFFEIIFIEASETVQTKFRRAVMF